MWSLGNCVDDLTDKRRLSFYTTLASFFWGTALKQNKDKLKKKNKLSSLRTSGHESFSDKSGTPALSCCKEPNLKPASHASLTLPSLHLALAFCHF